MTVDSDRLELAEYLRTTINQLSMVPAFQGSPGPRQLFFNDFVVIAMRFSGADNNISDNKVRLIWDIEQDISAGDKSTLTESHLTQLRDLLQKIYTENRDDYAINKMPRSVRVLEGYDRENGTQYAEKAKEMFYRFAIAVTAADSKIAAEEQINLSAFKELSWPSEVTTKTQEPGTGSLQEGGNSTHATQ